MKSYIDIDFIDDIIEKKDKERNFEYITRLKEKIIEMKGKLIKIESLKNEIELQFNNLEIIIKDSQNRKYDINIFNELLMKFNNQITIKNVKLDTIEGLLKEIKDLSKIINKNKEELPQILRSNSKEETTLCKLNYQQFYKLYSQVAEMKILIEEQEAMFNKNDTNFNQNKMTNEMPIIQPFQQFNKMKMAGQNPLMNQAQQMKGQNPMVGQYNPMMEQNDIIYCGHLTNEFNLGYYPFYLFRNLQPCFSIKNYKILFYTDFLKINEKKVVTSVLYQNYPDFIIQKSMPQYFDIYLAIKFYDFLNHKCETITYKCTIKFGIIYKLLMIKDNILLCGNLLIDTNTYKIIYNIKDIIFEGYCKYIRYVNNYYKLANGNIIVIAVTINSKIIKNEYKFENNRLNKIKEIDFENDNNNEIYELLENRKEEIITIKNKCIKIWK